MKKHAVFQLTSQKTYIQNKKSLPQKLKKNQLKDFRRCRSGQVLYHFYWVYFSFLENPLEINISFMNQRLNSIYVLSVEIRFGKALLFMNKIIVELFRIRLFWYPSLPFDQFFVWLKTLSGQLLNYVHEDYTFVQQLIFSSKGWIFAKAETIFRWMKNNCVAINHQ